MKSQHIIPVFVVIAVLGGWSGYAMSADDHSPVEPAAETAVTVPSSDASADEVEAAAEIPPVEGTTADAAHAPDHNAEQEQGSHEADGAAAHGGGHGSNLEHHDWHFSGMFGSYDRAALQRGLKVYREVCAACHSLKRVYFRNLEALGYDEGQIKNIASQYSVTDGPNDEGEMFDRPGLPSDHFVSPYPNDNAAKSVNNGALPPDLSLITKARHHGPDHVYGILNGYAQPPAGTTLLPNQYWNKHMPGNIIAMAPPLSDGQVAYEDDVPQTVDQYSRDVVEFLAWAADPYLEDRKRTGIKVLIFLAVFAGIMYAVKRRIWANLH
jgi:ubiquinol-cytochrome c reductase cytochrome c1 subunit